MMNPKSIEELEGENRILRAQLERLDQEAYLLRCQLAENVEDIADLLDEMENYDSGTCDLCLGDCNASEASNDGSN
jgi:prefoldin subunit 5